MVYLLFIHTFIIHILYKKAFKEVNNLNKTFEKKRKKRSSPFQLYPKAITILKKNCVWLNAQRGKKSFDSLNCGGS